MLISILNAMSVYYPIAKATELYGEFTSMGMNARYPLGRDSEAFFSFLIFGLQKCSRADNTIQNMIYVVLKPLCNMTAITLDLRPVVDLTDE